MKMLSPLTPSFSELLYSLVKPSWLARILLHDTSLVKRPLVEGKRQWMRSVLHTTHQAYTCFCWQLHSSPYLGPQRISTRNDYSARNGKTFLVFPKLHPTSFSATPLHFLCLSQEWIFFWKILNFKCHSYALILG